MLLTSYSLRSLTIIYWARYALNSKKCTKTRFALNFLLQHPYSRISYFQHFGMSYSLRSLLCLTINPNKSGFFYQNCSLCITTFSIQQKSTKIDYGSDDHMFRNIWTVFAHPQKTRAISRFVYFFVYPTKHVNFQFIKWKIKMIYYLEIKARKKPLKLHYTFEKIYDFQKLDLGL